MTRRFTYALGLVPPRHQSQLFASIRTGLDPIEGARTTPHITLKQPFEAVIDERALVDAVSAVCTRQVPFEVQLEEVAVFQSAGHGCVLHYRVQRCDSLIALAAQLIQTVRGFCAAVHDLITDSEPAHFYPHLTLAQGLSPMAAEAARSQLASLAPHCFEASTVVVGRRGPDHHWHIPYEIALGPHTRESASAPGTLFS